MQVRNASHRFWFKIDFGSIHFSLFSFSKYLKLPSLDWFIESNSMPTDWINAFADRLGEKDKSAFRVMVIGLLVCFCIVIVQKIVEHI